VLLDAGLDPRAAEPVATRTRGPARRRRRRAVRDFEQGSASAEVRRLKRALQARRTASSDTPRDWISICMAGWRAMRDASAIWRRPAWRNCTRRALGRRAPRAGGTWSDDGHCPGHGATSHGRCCCPTAAARCRGLTTARLRLWDLDGAAEPACSPGMKAQ
jgi:hypothetical protein